MMKKWSFPNLVIATRNKNKLRQFADLFGKELHIDVKGLNDFYGLPEIIEDQDSFEGNALKKAEFVCNLLQIPVISDDSGLVVPALGGEPGIYSARYAGSDADDQQNIGRLLRKIKFISKGNRSAKYVCVMALAIPEEEIKVVRGECEGIIITELRGKQGFGYDPIFYLPKEHKTMAEISAGRRYQISHRAKATEKIIEILREEYIF
jgi:XTP/dITP diphosphohydrolase